MKTITKNFKIQNPICDVNRRYQVFILCQDPQGYFILGQKHGYYPNTISRMIGGGLKDGEGPKVAAIREMREELGIHMEFTRLKEISIIRANMETNGQSILLDTYIYYALIDDKNIKPADDISGLTYLSEKEFESLIQKMENNLYGTFEGVTKGEKVIFRWYDWGKVYGFIHRQALNWHKNNIEVQNG